MQDDEGIPKLGAVMARVSRLHLSWKRRVQKNLLPWGITPKQIYLLKVLSKRGGLRPSEVADLTFSDRPTATSVAATMAKAGWIRTERDPDDGRGKILRLTEGGAALLASIPRRLWAAGEAEGEPESVLAAEERRVLYALLGKMLRGADGSPGADRRDAAAEAAKGIAMGISLSGIKMSYAETEREGVRQACRSYRVGPDRPADLVFLHGAMSRSTNWDLVARRFAADGWCVLAPDMRGHGLSGSPAASGRAYAREALVEDFAAVADAFCADRFVLVGHSTGALNAWVYAAAHPERVAALCLEDMGAASKGSADAESWRTWLASWPVPFPSLRSVRDYFGALRPSHADHFMEFFREGGDGWRPMFDPEAIVAVIAGNNERDWWEELSRARCPALVVKGAESDLPLEEAERMRAELPKGSLAVVEGAGHVVHEDRPDEFCRLLEGFLSSSGAAPGLLSGA